MNQAPEELMFATAFYHAGGHSPNAWTFSESSRLEMYYRCMVVCYASLRRLYGKARLVLFSNRDLPEPYRSQLQSLGVSTELCPSPYVEDAAFKNAFPGCLFTLDVIDHLARKDAQEVGAVILLDNDCIVRECLDGVLDQLLEQRVIYAYEPGYPVNMPVNGQSRASLTLAMSYMQEKLVDLPVRLYGGEFYAFAYGTLPEVAERIRLFWDWMKTRGSAIFGGELTEEHVMSIALAMCESPILDAGNAVKRIWTTDHFSTVNGTESQISVWHLPSEKKRAFRRLYRYWVEKNGFEHLGDAEFMKLVDDEVRLQHGKRGGTGLLRRVRSAAKYLVMGRL